MRSDVYIAREIKTTSTMYQPKVLSALKLAFIFSLIGLGVLSSCKEIQKAIQETEALTKCQYRIATVNNIQLAGVPFQNVKGVKDLSLANAAALASAYLNKNMPLTFNLNVAIKNPTTQNAAFSGMDWILLIDGTEYLNGVVSDRISIAPNGGTSNLPVNIHLNLTQLLSGKGKDQLLNFASALSNADGTSTRITMKIRPSFTVAGQNYKWPNHFVINKDFKAPSK
jgi:hypothetical protein